ncbi:hypothetical protein [Streptomyces sp. NPDC020742]|uniref:hypothetical protein n=1 Tax=unclassified Streptomyces TaxID=2593676 RepID=UPI0033D27F1D
MPAAFRRSPAGPASRLPGSGLRARLPWWALALPVVSFTALLVLMLAASPSRASAPSVPQSLAPLLEILLRIVRPGS